MADPSGFQVILASASPRRQELMKLLYDQVVVIPAQSDERTEETEPSRMVVELAKNKATEVAMKVPRGSVVIGADTVVAVDGAVLGKPKDQDDAQKMLQLLSGRSHQVFTGVAVLLENTCIADYEMTTVEFAPMTESEIRDYVSTGEPMDKAGAYGIQGGAARFIRRIDGCYYNVMGLPVHKLYEILKSL